MIVQILKRSSLAALSLAAFISCGHSSVIEDFENGIGNWTEEGEAFKVSSGDKNVTGYSGNSFLTVDEDESLSGSITSVPFTIKGKFINMLLAGPKGSGFGRGAAASLIVDGNAVRTSSPIGDDPKKFEWVSWDVEEFGGKEASIKVEVPPARSFAGRTLPRGSIMVDRIEQGPKRLSSFYDEYSLTLKADGKYLLIPASDKGTNSRLSVEVDGENILGNAQSIRAATSEIGYYIPVNIGKYSGKPVTVKLTGIKTSDAVYGNIKTSDETPNSPTEQYRPLVHFSPSFGWTNDPNGMVYVDGKWHLSLQYNPYGTTHGNMHWGLSVSDDLIHWTDKDPVIAPDELGSIFSGSAVVDHDNTAGFGKDAVVAIYTSAGAGQRQSIAYSTDGGYTFTKYSGNPVLSDPDQRDFRDPKVNRIGDQWVMALACGQVIRFYGSKDLKEWTFLSDFGTGLGSHDGVWECPDLLKFNYQGKDKWVLFVSINPGSPHGGSITQYFIGDFDGKRFKADNLPYPLWVDSGADNYAGVTYADAPGGRTVFMGWMSNRAYTGSTPTTFFRNSMTLPRDLSLKSDGRHLILASVPSPEVDAARSGGRDVDGVSSSKSMDISEILPSNKGAYEIDFTIVPEGKGNISFSLSNGKGETAIWELDPAGGKISFDRSRSGITDFSPSFAAKPVTTALPTRKEYKCRLFVDRLSTELFVNDGDFVFTNCVFPTEVYNTFGVKSADSQFSVKDIKIYELK